MLMQEGQGSVPQRDQFPERPSHVMGANQARGSLAEKIQSSNMWQSLKEACLAYVQSPSPENFAKLKAQGDALIKTRRMLLTVGRYAESQTTLAILSMISGVIAEKGTLEQRAQIDFVVLVQQALVELAEVAEKLTLEDVTLIIITWDAWLFSALPRCLQVNSYHSERPESFSGLLSCLLIHRAVGRVETFEPLVSEIRTAAIDLLQLKGKRFYLKAWLDDIFTKKPRFDWRAHREVQNKKWGSVFSLAEIMSFFEHDQPLLLELRDVATLDASLEELKKADYLKRPEEKDIGAILKHMEALADTLSARASPEGNHYWQERSMNAQMFYSGVLFTLKNPRWKIATKTHEAVRQRVIEKIKELELNLLKGVNGQRQEKLSWKKDSRYLKQLEGYRKKARAELLAIIPKEVGNDNQLLKRAEQLDTFSQSVLVFMKDFINSLIAASIADLGPVPCHYAFIGLGSFEKQSMTPYSDLEFSILIQEDFEENRKYFRNLTYILQAKIIQLGETPIPMSLFDYNFDHLTNAGFCFDLGGKIALGRRYDEYDEVKKKYGTLKYELIKTPKDLLRYIEDDHFLVDKLLPVQLSQCAYMAGDIKLVDDYQQLLAERMTKNEQGKLFRQLRAMTYMQGNQSLEGDLEKYMPKLDGSKDGHLFDVKKEIYRLPDRLISDLALFFGIMVGSSLQKINQLLNKKVITQENAQHLKIMDGIAKEIRFSTYFYYGGQREHISVLPQLFKEDRTLFRLDNIALLERFYQSAFPYQQQLQLFFRAWEKTPRLEVEILKMRKFNDPSLAMRMKIARRLGQHEKVQKLLKEMLKEHSQSQDVGVLTELADSYFSSAEYERSAYYLRQALKIEQGGSSPDHFKLAAILANLGSAYGALGDYKKAVIEQRKALSILEQRFGEEDARLATLCSNLGVSYCDFGDSLKAVNLQERALRIQERAIGADAPQVAITLVGLGNTYGALEDYQKQVSLQERALRIDERVFGGEHINLAVTLMNLGNAYGGLGNHKKQMSLQQRALTIQEGNLVEKHVQIAATKASLGIAYGALGDYTMQVELQESALRVQEQNYPKDHMYLVPTLVNLGSAYGALKNYQKQVQLQERALRIQEQTYPTEHMNLVATLVNLGCAYGALENYQSQVRLQKRALRIQEQNYRTEHMNLVPTLHCLGKAYAALGKFQKEESFQLRAQRILWQDFGADHLEASHSPRFFNIKGPAEPNVLRESQSQIADDVNDEQDLLI
jgi:tetratricopeptide (TPR) repeat protein